MPHTVINILYSAGTEMRTENNEIRSGKETHKLNDDCKIVLGIWRKRGKHALKIYENPKNIHDRMLRNTERHGSFVGRETHFDIKLDIFSANQCKRVEECL